MPVHLTGKRIPSCNDEACCTAQIHSRLKFYEADDNDDDNDTEIKSQYYSHK